MPVSSCGRFVAHQTIPFTSWLHCNTCTAVPLVRPARTTGETLLGDTFSPPKPVVPGRIDQALKKHSRESRANLDGGGTVLHKGRLIPSKEYNVLLRRLRELKATFERYMQLKVLELLPSIEHKQTHLSQSLTPIMLGTLVSHFAVH